MKEFMEVVIKALIDHPSDLKVDVQNTGNMIITKVKLNKADLGKVIGKNGKHATAIRTLATAIAAKNRKKALFEIME